jgi:hypothetical protein
LCVKDVDARAKRGHDEIKMHAVTSGQKRVEDARRRAYDPRVHHSSKKLLAKTMDCRVKPGNDQCRLYASHVPVAQFPCKFL